MSTLLFGLHDNTIKLMDSEEGDDDDLDAGGGRRSRRGNTPDYIYNPPSEVRKRQFCSMSKEFGFDDVVEFALVVEGWTQAQRRDALEKFYRKRRRMLDVGRERKTADGLLEAVKKTEGAEEKSEAKMDADEEWSF